MDELAAVAERGKNVFPALLEAAEVCSLGQITGRLQEVVGRFRPMGWRESTNVGGALVPRLSDR